MKIKDFLELDIKELADLYEKSKPVPANVSAEPKKTEPKTATADPEAKPKYNGEGNPMKLRKMCTDRGIDAPTKKNAAFYVDLLLEDDEAGKKEKPAMNKPTAAKVEGGKLSEETYDKTQVYTEAQLRTATLRGLYNIGRKVFDIPRDQMSTKDDAVAALLKAQGGGSKAEPEESDDPYAGLKAKALYKMCIERGIKTKMQLSADVYKELLIQNDAENAAVNDDEEDEYAGMTEVALYKLCKAQGLEAKTKQDRSYYIEILQAAEEEDDEDEEWSDDDDEEENWDMN